MLTWPLMQSIDIIELGSRKGGREQPNPIKKRVLKRKEWDTLNAPSELYNGVLLTIQRTNIT